MEPWKTVGAGFAKGVCQCSSTYISALVEDTKTQLQYPLRKRQMAVELDAAEALIDFSPCGWIGHTPRCRNEPYHGHHCSVPLSLRAGSEPQEEMGSFWIVVSIVSWSKTANGRSVLILGQVVSSFCGLPVLTVAEVKKGERQIYFICTILQSPRVVFLRCHIVC